MTARDPLDALRPVPPDATLRVRVLDAARAVRRDSTTSPNWLDAAVESALLRNLWRFAMLAAILAHLWVDSEATRAARRWRLIPEPAPAAIGAPGSLAAATSFGDERLP
ncbi:MAG: hypothetical protein AMXMBFR36_03440 [Acidobacteriota bacterium]